VKDYHQDAVDANSPAFVNYLETMPGWESLAKCDDDESCRNREKWDPTDPYACGRAREHFGFDANFIHDKRICEDINQFKNSRDFKFLEEFFKQGTPAKSDGPDDTEPPLVPALVLKKPAAGKYLHEFVNGKKLEACDWLIFVSLYYLLFA
jgi:hypothetical protein